MSTTVAAEHAADTNDKLTEGLGRLLADSYMVYLKTQNFHRNVRGALFHTLHVMFEEQYTEMATAIDEIAERIRTLGAPAPGSFTEFAKLTTITEETESPTAHEMIEILVSDQQKIVLTAKSIVDAAEQNGDEPTLDLLVRRMQVHEKNIWMLKSLID